MSGRLDQRGQEGYLLASVIGLIGLVAVVGAVLFSMTLTALESTESFRENLDNVSASDSALEMVIHDLRSDPAAVGTACHGASDQGGGHTTAYAKTVSFPDGDTVDVIVDCQSASPYTPSRDITLEAFPAGSSGSEAKTRIVIVDVVNGQPRPGYAMKVCDWQLGANVRGSVAACP